MGAASNLIGGMEEGNEGLSALENELLGIEATVPDTSFKVKVFINMDEDDEGGKGIDLN
jgi:hypothetical protein